MVTGFADWWFSKQWHVCQLFSDSVNSDIFCRLLIQKRVICTSQIYDQRSSMSTIFTESLNLYSICLHKEIQREMRNLAWNETMFLELVSFIPRETKCTLDDHILATFLHFTVKIKSLFFLDLDIFLNFLLQKNKSLYQIQRKRRPSTLQKLCWNTSFAKLVKLIYQRSPLPIVVWFFHSHKTNTSLYCNENQQISNIYRIQLCWDIGNLCFVRQITH